MPEPTEPRPRARRGRPPSVDRDAIVRAAVAVGFDQLAMTSVADRLGVRHSALYRYFPTRDELAAAAVDHVVDQARWPEPTSDWRAHLDAYARCHFALLEQHPGLAREIVSLKIDSPSYQAVGYRAMAALTDLGFTPENAILACDLVAEQALFFFLAGQPAAPDPSSTTTEAATRRRALMASTPPDAAPAIHTAMNRVVTGPPQAWFARKLDTVLNGITHLAPSASGRRDADMP